MQNFIVDREVRPPQLSSAISFYLRKLLRQNLDRLTLQPTDLDVGAEAQPVSLPSGLSSDPHLMVERLYPDVTERSQVIQQLESLAHQHQSLASHGLQRRQELRQTEQQLFLMLGFTLSQSPEAGTILIIDDNSESLTQLTAALTQAGYEVRTATNGTLALSRAQLITPDLILLDVEVPGLNGYEICRQLKRDGRSDDIPVMFLSALNRVESKVKAFEVGAADYITKPFQIEEVLARIANQLERSNLQRRIEEQNIRLQQEIQERQQAEERYRTFFAYTLDGVFQTTLDGHFINANPSLARILGYESREALLEMVDNVSRIYVHPRRRAEFMSQLQEHEVVSEFESQVRRRDGSTITVVESARTIRDPEGRVLFYEGFMRDLSELRQATAGWQRGRQRVHRLLLSIFPKAIAREFIKRESTVAHRYAQVAMLVVDLSVFTPLAAQLSAVELIDQLNSLTVTFDQLVRRAGLERVHAASDRYVVVAGLPSAHPNAAAAIAELAVSMQQVVSQFQADSKTALPSLAMGLHQGPVSAGVVGEAKLSYQLWGDTVCQAEAIATQATPGEIYVSEALVPELHRHYRLTPHRGLDPKDGPAKDGKAIAYRLDHKLLRQFS